MRNEILERYMEESLLLRHHGENPVVYDPENNASPAPSKRVLLRVSAGLDCMRAGAYYLMGTKEMPSDPTSAAAAELGSVIEAATLYDLRYALTKAESRAFEYKEQVRVTTDHYTGKADMDVEELSLIADAKATNAAAFEILARENKPKDGHVRQVAAYGIPLGRTRAIVAYRGTGNTKKVGGGRVYMVFDFPLTPDMAEPVRVNAIGARAARDTGQLPARPYAQSYWLCRDYCSYRDTCWKENA